MKNIRRIWIFHWLSTEQNVDLQSKEDVPSALAKQMGSKTIEFIESRLEHKFQLEINREKTRVVDLREEGASLNFPGIYVSV